MDFMVPACGLTLEKINNLSGNSCSALTECLPHLFNRDNNYKHTDTVEHSGTDAYRKDGAMQVSSVSTCVVTISVLILCYRHHGIICKTQNGAIFM